MPQELTIPMIIQLKNICQYLSLNAISKANLFKGKALDERVGKMIYVEGKSVELRYAQDPNDTTLRGTANYLYSLLNRWLLQAETILQTLSVAPPTIAGPANQSVNVGQNAIFTVTVNSTVAYTVQWYDFAGNPIVGATSLSYTFTNAQLTDSGKTFFVKATNSAGTVTSTIAVLVVAQVLTGNFAYMPTDPYPVLLTSIDNFVYQVSFSITHNANFTITMPAASAPNQYLIVKVPVGEPVKATWFNDNFNNGVIPDFNWQTLLQFGGFTYYASRQALSLNTGNTLILS